MQTKSDFFKKTAAMALSCVMLTGLAPTNVFAAAASFTLDPATVTVNTATVPLDFEITGENIEIEEVWLDYWTTASDKKDKAGTDDETQSFSLTGLTPGTKYYYQAFVLFTEEDEDGDPQEQEVVSAQKSFTTAAAVAPTVSFEKPTRTDDGKITLKGSYTNNSGGALNARGFVYSTSATGSASGTKIPVSGTGSPFTTTYTIDMASTEKTYFFWAYVTVGNTTTYSGGVTTPVIVPAKASTAPSIALDTAKFSDKTMTVECDITATGGGSVLENGVVYSTTDTTPEIGDSKAASTDHSGEYTATFTVTQGKTYYIRAFARNSAGTKYSAAVTRYIPEVTTSSVSASGTTLTVKTDWTKNNDIEEKGVIYSTSSTAALTSSTWKDKEYTGSSDPFTSSLSGLSQGTKYYVRSYAATDYGTSYGVAKNATTSGSSSDNGKPVVETDDITNITDDSARVYIDVTSSGGYSITERGVVYSETQKTPTLTTTKTDTEEYSGTTGRNYETINGLEPDTKYYVRAYAKNSKGTSYGDVETFTTKDEEYDSDYDEDDEGDADIETVDVIDITGGGATVIGQIDDADGSVSEKGFVYDDRANPTLSSGSKIISASKATGRYSLDIDDLEPEETYYVRAYVRTSGGTTYGDELEFETNDEPSARTMPATDIGETGATLNGSVSNPSDEDVDEKGFVYSQTNSEPTLEDTRVAHSSRSEGKFSMNLTDLEWDEEYYFRAYLKTEDAITYGRVQTFTTKESTGTITVDFKTIYGVHVKTQTITEETGTKINENDLDVPAGYELYEPEWDYTIGGREAVTILVTKDEKAFMEGIGNGFFAPDQAATRAEVAQAIYNLAADKTTEGDAMSFRDVPAYHATEKAIEYCSAKGYMNGFPDGTFRPEDKITRVQMAVVLTKVYELSGSPSANFSDVARDYWGYNYIALVSEQNMMNGYPNGTFGYDNTATRAEVCTLFSNAERRTLEPLGNEEFSDVPEDHWAYDFIMNAAMPE